MPTGIVTRGVIFRALGGNMRKFKRFRPRTLPFRLLVIAAGALMLMAAFAPRADALVAYFNFEDSTDGGVPDFTSDTVGAPDFNPGGGALLTTITTNYNAANMVSTNPGFALNRTAGDIDVFPATPDLCLSLSRTSPNNGSHFDIPLFTPAGIEGITLSFAYLNHGNGFTTATFQFSTDGGGTFNSFAGNVQTMITGGVMLLSQTFPVAAEDKPLLVLRMILTGGTSNGADPQTQIDNIQIGGTIIPEPTTIAGGLLGVLGLCWHQRRRLIGFVRFRRASV